MENIKQILKSIEAKIVSDNIVIAQRAAKAQAEYRKRGGKREFLIPDFLIGANAEFYSKRGLERVKGEFNLMCIAYNLKEIARLIVNKGIGVFKGVNKSNYIINISHILSISGLSGKPNGILLL